MSEDKQEPSDAQAEIDRVRDEILAAPAPGTTPDARRIAEKHEAARKRNEGLAPDDEDESESKVRATKVQGRTATPPSRAKAAEEK